MKWAAIRPRMFVVLRCWDHWEEFDEDEEGYTPSGTGRFDPEGACPFEVRGQVVRVTSTHVWVDGRWTWLTNGEATHGVFGVVRGAVRSVNPISPRNSTSR